MCVEAALCESAAAAREYFDARTNQSNGHHGHDAAQKCVLIHVLDHHHDIRILQ